MLRGSAAVLAQVSMLECLAESCAQSGAMQWLEYFVSAPSMMKKEPYLVLLLRSGADPAQWQTEDVWGAVLMFEYIVLGVPTRAFSTDDVTGFRTVIAPAELRSAAAAMAADAVVEHGGQFVLVSYDSGSQRAGEPRLANAKLVQWARRRRPVQKALPLGETYEATLASLGKSTRFNLRYYRKRLAKKLDFEFVADARGLLNAAELDAMNMASLNPVATDQFMLRYKSASELPGGFVVGLRARDGQWLSMVGGWRQGSVSVLHWQMNAAGFEKDSLGTVMRSFLLEHEVAMGSRTLVIYGGTVHSVGNSFVREEVTDLVVRRKGWGGMVLRVLSKLSCTMDTVCGRQKNFLARLIAEDELQWQPVKHAAGRRAMVLLRSAK